MSTLEPKSPPETPRRARGRHPYLILALAILLPGSGQVLNGTPTRGLIMLFFMLQLGWVTYHLTTPAHSMVGRYAGGIFVYAISVLDAYRSARYRWALGATPGATAAQG